MQPRKIAAKAPGGGGSDIPSPLDLHIGRIDSGGSSLSGTPTAASSPPPKSSLAFDVRRISHPTPGLPSHIPSPPASTASSSPIASPSETPRAAEASRLGKKSGGSVRDLGGHGEAASPGRAGSISAGGADEEAVVAERVKVTIRVRPMSAAEREASAGLPPAVDLDSQEHRIALHRRGGVVDVTEFEFDAVLAPNASQEDVYRVAALPVVMDVLNGYNGTVMAYGQTGAGKTHTLSNVDSAALGIVPRSVAEVFRAADSDLDHDYRVKMSYIQIYMELLQDLLRPTSTNMAIREGEHGVYVEGVEEVEVKCVEDCLKLLHVGERNRTVAFTKMNAHSSRSHALALLTVEKRQKYHQPQQKQVPVQQTIGGVGVRRKSFSQDAKDYTPPREPSKVLVGKLFLVDLAGSERLKKSGSEGLRASEAKSVNLSLTVLGKCINARTDPTVTHIPFRDSKLTRLLQESLGGNAKTSLVICVGPCVDHVPESLSSLLFAQRAMKVVTRAVVNETEDYRDISRTLQEELDRHDEKLHSLEAVLFTQEEQLEQVKASLALQSAGMKKLKADREEDAARHRAALEAAEAAAEARVAAAESKLEEAARAHRAALADAEDRAAFAARAHSHEKEILQGELRQSALQRDGLVEALGRAKAQVAALQRQVTEMERQKEEAKQAGKAEAVRKALEDRCARRIQRVFRKLRFNRLVRQLVARSKEAEDKGRAIARLTSEKQELQATAAAAGRKLVADSIQHVESAMAALVAVALGDKRK